VYLGGRGYFRRTNGVLARAASRRITATFFYGTGLREHCEANPIFGYELMKRISKVTLERLQMARDQMLALYSENKDRE
jgi:hypothetical protein